MFTGMAFDSGPAFTGGQAGGTPHPYHSLLLVLHARQALGVLRRNDWLGHGLCWLYVVLWSPPDRDWEQ
jgi:hypothetical protein